MIKEEIVQTRINGANRKHYEALGYTGSHNELIDVLVEHLPEKSNMVVTSICDDCGSERLNKYNQHRDLCPNCVTKGERSKFYSKTRNICSCGESKARRAKCWECYTKEVHNPDAIKRSNSDHRWSKEVREIANYTCNCCGSDEDLCAHHLDSFMDKEHLRRDLANGVCLCRTCHLAFHKQFGFGNNTTKQYLEFKENYNGCN